ncbi:hypothetical protein CYMTET_36810 [Cymbomonas tetramitiformis]|uniref:Uncharacterized protein n=1 Tax=Cymbomonas tetramitiformis TaxID=36881 RepID=A0AAE0F7R9_9CHLO|nr:hypothetical protein CYMTET_36810 [Cymbomonas tetramitiformis]
MVDISTGAVQTLEAIVEVTKAVPESFIKECGERATWFSNHQVLTIASHSEDEDCVTPGASASACQIWIWRFQLVAGTETPESALVRAVFTESCMRCARDVWSSAENVINYLENVSAIALLVAEVTGDLSLHDDESADTAEDSSQSHAENQITIQAKSPNFPVPEEVGSNLPQDPDSVYHATVKSAQSQVKEQEGGMYLVVHPIMVQDAASSSAPATCYGLIAAMGTREEQQALGNTLVTIAQQISAAVAQMSHQMDAQIGEINTRTRHRRASGITLQLEAKNWQPAADTINETGSAQQLDDSSNSPRGHSNRVHRERQILAKCKTIPVWDKACAEATSAKQGKAKVEQFLSGHIQLRNVLSEMRRYASVPREVIAVVAFTGLLLNGDDSSFTTISGYNAGDLSKYQNALKPLWRACCGDVLNPLVTHADGKHKKVQIYERMINWGPDAIAYSTECTSAMERLKGITSTATFGKQMRSHQAIIMALDEWNNTAHNMWLAESLKRTIRIQVRAEIVPTMMGQKTPAN